MMGPCVHQHKRSSRACWPCHKAKVQSRVCSVADCDRKHLAGGLCARHYHRRRTHGSADAKVISVERGDVVTRFWPKVDKNGPIPAAHPELGPCWVWTRGTSDAGYGIFQMGKTEQGAHRVAYELEVGPIPPGLSLDHLCENPPCVRPSHLEPVTRGENNRRAGVRNRTCRRGHEWTPKSTYVRPDTGIRSCRICALDRARGRPDTRRHLPSRIRAAVMARYGGRCVYGNCPANSIDHVVPVAMRRRHHIADDDERYLVAACLSHNVIKGTHKLHPRGFDVALLPGKDWLEWHGEPLSQMYAK